MTGKEILSIKKAGDLFSNEKEKCKEEYKQLVKQWHPDTTRETEAEQVLKKINTLYIQAQIYFQQKIWEKTGEIQFTKKTGRQIQIHYQTKFPFELGYCYICNQYIIYILEREKEKYYHNAIEHIEKLDYKDLKMKNKLGRLFPKIYDTYSTTEDWHVIVLEKEKEIYPLKNVFISLQKEIEPRHVAWMISRLCNISCYFQYHRLVHNAITLENCFVSLEEHSIFLFGGFWYSTEIGEKMLGISKEIYQEALSIKAKSTKHSEYTTDLEAVKLLGRKLLGESNARKLAENSKIPKPFLEFLITGAGDNAWEQMREWEIVLDKSYGKRKFIPIHIKKEEIYRAERKEIF